MRILLDECVDQRLRLLFASHDCQTAAYAGLAGLKNGAMLAGAEHAGFEVLVTTDREIPFQQNIALRFNTLRPNESLGRFADPRSGGESGVTNDHCRGGDPYTELIAGQGRRMIAPARPGAAWFARRMCDITKITRMSAIPDFPFV